MTPIAIYVCQEYFPKYFTQGRGADQGGDYQFDIYRSMKQHNQVLTKESEFKAIYPEDLMF